MIRNFNFNDRRKFFFIEIPSFYIEKNGCLACNKWIFLAVLEICESISLFFVTFLKQCVKFVGNIWNLVTGFYKNIEPPSGIFYLILNTT